MSEMSENFEYKKQEIQIGKAKIYVQFDPIRQSTSYY